MPGPLIDLSDRGGRGFVVQTSRLDPSCQFRPEQSAQIPLITKLIVSAENPSGRPTCGTATPRRQKVRRQCVQ